VTLFKLVKVTSMAVLLPWAIAINGAVSAQEQPRDPPPQNRQKATEDSALPSDAPGNVVGDGIRLPLSYLPETSRKAEVGKRFGIKSLDFGTRGLSGDIAGDTGFGPVNPNAPWKVGGGITYSPGSGTIARLGVVGSRNYRVPLFMSQTIGSDRDLTLPLVSFTDLSQREVQWEISAGVEKTLIRIHGGVTIGAVADLFVPLNRISPPRVAPQTHVPASITVRGGVKLGF
jgi:hypothetical protein